MVAKDSSFHSFLLRFFFSSFSLLSLLSFFYSFRNTPTFYVDYIRQVGLINIARQVDEIRVNRWNVALYGGVKKEDAAN